VQRFLTIGECMVEMAPAEGGLYAMGFAGDTFNTAWYVRRLAEERVEVSYLSAIGTDPISARMEAFMREAGIVPRLEARTDSTVPSRRGTDRPSGTHAARRPNTARG